MSKYRGYVWENCNLVIDIIFVPKYCNCKFHEKKYILKTVDTHCVVQNCSNIEKENSKIYVVGIYFQYKWKS